MSRCSILDFSAKRTAADSPPSGQSCSKSGVLDAQGPMRQHIDHSTDHHAPDLGTRPLRSSIAALHRRVSTRLHRDVVVVVVQGPVPRRPSPRRNRGQESKVGRPQKVARGKDKESLALRAHLLGSPAPPPLRPFLVCAEAVRVVAPAPAPDDTGQKGHR
jgi:hypothetical protein